MNLQGHTQTSVLVLAKELFYYLMIKLKNLINQKYKFSKWNIIVFLFASTKNTNNIYN